LTILSAPETTEVIYGADNIMNKVLNALSNVKECVDGCYHSTGLLMIITTEPLWKTLNELVKRGVRLRYITDINRDNISHCKQMMEGGHQLRHLAGIKTNFRITDRMEYLANVVLEENKSLWQIIVSNVKTFVEGQQYVFDTLWSKALPAEQRIREIEGYPTVKYETKVLNTTEETLACLKSAIESANERFVVGSIGALQIIYDNFFDLYKRIIEKQRRGEGKGVRWITSIYGGSNIELVKIFLDAGVQIRRIKNLPPMNFAVDNRYFYATIEDMEKGRIMQSLLTSNEPSYVKHFMSIFEEMWKNAVDASKAIRNIENGVDPNALERHKSDNEEDMKDYLNEVLKEIRRIRDSHRLSC
jgi:hypothetical protein